MEVLIVLSIISLLLQLAIPAIEAARESARQTACQNNMRQICIGANLHVNTHEFYPTGGWTSVYVGDPNRGFGKDQPGSWCFNLLPFLENQALHDLGKGALEADRRAAAARVFSTPVPVFVCPSRRLPRAWRLNRTLFNSIKPETAARSDYAANMGNLQPSDQRGPGPTSYEEAIRWVNGTDRLTQWVGWRQNGVVYQRSEISPHHITDGLSKTFLFGEKFLAPKYYTNGKSDGDDQGLCVGFDRDIARSTNTLHPPIRDANIESLWLAEGDHERVLTWNFGSAHYSALNMASCDGSVARVSYDVDARVFVQKGSRNGGEH